MLKKNSFINKLNKLLISVFEIIESFFNNLKVFFKFKKGKIDNENFEKKIFIVFGSSFILILSYFLLPALIDKKIIINKLENQIFEKLVKICFWGGFGPIWAPDSNSAQKLENNYGLKRFIRQMKKLPL